MTTLRGLLALGLALLFLMMGSAPTLAHGLNGHRDEPVAIEDVDVATPTFVGDDAVDGTAIDEPAVAHEPSDAPAITHTGLGDVLRALHPATVHFPIAFFLLAGVLEAMALARRRSEYLATVDILVITGAIGAVLAALFGWIHTGLWLGGDASMQWHRWTGTGVALAGIAMLIWLRRQNRRALRASLALVCVALLAQGYWGGELAHGPNHLARTH